MIGDPMNKVHIGKNKSFLSSSSTKIDFKSIMFNPMMCPSARYSIIERLNFIVKILYYVRILV